MNWRRALIQAALSMIPLALPLILMAVWRSGDAGGETDHFFQILTKLYALVAALRDRWLFWDSFGVGAALVLIGAALFDNRFEVARKLGFPAAVLALTFILMPARIFGSAYADMRLAPIMLMVALLAIRIRPQHAPLDRTLAWLGLAFVVLRLGGNTISFAMADRQARTLLTAVNLIPRGAPVLSLAGDYCLERWDMPRNSHLGSFVIIRKRGFSNDQWQAAGAQLLRVNYPKAGFFSDDRSSLVYSQNCIRRTAELEGKQLTDTRTALRYFPRNSFDYVWIIDPPDFDLKTGQPGLKPIWHSERSVLYRVDHSYAHAADTATPRASIQSH